MAAPHMSEKPADGADRPSGWRLAARRRKSSPGTPLASSQRRTTRDRRAARADGQHRAARARRQRGGRRGYRAAARARRQSGAERGLTPTVEEAVRESVRKDSHVLVEALFPVMGPAIRRSVAEVFRSTVESFNQVLESTFSIRGLQWRLRSHSHWAAVRRSGAAAQSGLSRRASFPDPPENEPCAAARGGSGRGHAGRGHGFEHAFGDSGFRAGFVQHAAERFARQCADGRRSRYGSSRDRRRLSPP